MRMATAISVLLMLSLSAAAVITVDSKHVFEGEEFTVTYTASAPLSQHDISMYFAEQGKIVSLPNMPVGIFSASVPFTAPAAGKYEVVSGEARAEVLVEPALLVLRDVSIEPMVISPRQSAKLKYTIENIGQLRVYNVKSRVVIPNSDQFNYNSDEQELFGMMSPGEKLVQVKEIMARENADREASVVLIVTYEYDNEIHRREELVRLGASSNDWAMFIILGIVVLAVAQAAISYGKRKRE